MSAKHGVMGLMRTLALELAPDMIRVNSLHPTTVNTDMIQNAATYELFASDLPEAERTAAVVSERLAGNALPVPWVEPVDISNAVLWLASDEARYVTGVRCPSTQGRSSSDCSPHDRGSEYRGPGAHLAAGGGAPGGPGA